ncbi:MULTISPECIES: hypothetical protein [Pseudoalteromonas]|uniref:hypothetical protein n=1 Tax=Pseudoalteromonas TaxID=53246 RepID=UPI001581D5BF|nr:MULTISPECIES: hypothetical protein [Pseudoalteromonas]MDI4652549.1 hypothetical protein [Pseudoalteromonas shioyasakiensis]NUJ38743.1 hypothetical protein [Pseudoalteromonas sp. 0303]
MKKYILTVFYILMGCSSGLALAGEATKGQINHWQLSATPFYLEPELYFLLGGVINLALLALYVFKVRHKPFNKSWKWWLSYCCSVGLIAVSGWYSVPVTTMAI